MHLPQMVFSSEQAAVYDNLLPPTAFQAVHDVVVADDFIPVQVRTGVVEEPDSERPAFRGSTTIYSVQRSVDEPGPHVYPTHTPLDVLIEHLLATATEIPDLVGLPGTDWASFAMSSWKYPAGTGLALHTDGATSYSGAFAFFCHTRWRLHWGGHLVLLDPATREPEPPTTLAERIQAIRAVRSEGKSEAYAWNPGIGVVILPKPNRIVFLAPDALHTVLKVDPSAGDHARLSLTGFFSRTRRAR